MTQATLSRDLKQLKVAKAASMNGNYVYVLPNNTMYKRMTEQHSASEMLMHNGFISIEFSANLAAIRDDSYVCALAIEGKMLDSVELSEKIERLGIDGVSSITFVIGGSLGLSDAVLKRADYKLSFSKMTFPHQLMRVILLEQIYRAYRIMKNEPYHK